MNPEMSARIGRRDLHLALYLLSVSKDNSARIVKILKKMHNKKIIKLSYEIKRTICQCNILLVPVVTCTSRIGKEEDGEYLYKKCLLCNCTSKMRVNSKRF